MKSQTLTRKLIFFYYAILLGSFACAKTINHDLDLEKLSVIGRRESGSSSTNYNPNVEKYLIDLEEINDVESPKPSSNNNNKKVIQKPNFKINLDYLNEVFVQKTILKPSDSSSNGNKLNRGLNQLKEIYNSLKNEPSNHYENINTIRYVPCSKIITRNKIHFMFNLSLLSPTEDLIKSEMFINTRFAKQKLIFNLHYLLYSSQNTTFTQKNKKRSSFDASTIIDLRNNRVFQSNQHQWQHFNIADSLRSYINVRNHKFRSTNQNNVNKNVYYSDSESKLNDQNSTQSLNELVLIMEAHKNPKSSDKSLSSDLINPYLIIYTNENENEMRNFFQNRIPPELINHYEQIQKNPEPSIEEVNAQNDSIELEETTTASPSSSSSTSSPSQSKNNFDYFVNHKDDSIVLIEEKVGILDQNLLKSRLKDAKELLNKNATELKFIFKANNDKKSKNKRNSGSILVDEDLNSNNNESLLSWDENAWIYEQQQDINDDQGEGGEILLHDSDDQCQLKPLIIDFSDMSFSDWIIEPKSYQSNLCVGTCKFPTSNNVRL
jgi:hypothetical protein